MAHQLPADLRPGPAGVGEAVAVMHESTAGPECVTPPGPVLDPTRKTPSATPFPVGAAGV
jgi:hypothetical protein